MSLIPPRWKREPSPRAAALEFEVGALHLQLDAAKRQLAEQSSALADARRCSTCGGDPNSHASKLLCVCENGTRDGEVDGLRRAVFDAQADAAQWQARATAALEMLSRCANTLRNWGYAAISSLEKERKLGEFESFLRSPDTQAALRRAEAERAELDALREEHAAAVECLQHIDTRNFHPESRVVIVRWRDRIIKTEAAQRALDTPAGGTEPTQTKETK